MNDQEFYSIENSQAVQKTNNGKIEEGLPRKDQMQGTAKKSLSTHEIKNINAKCFFRASEISIMVLHTKGPPKNLIDHLMDLLNQTVEF